MCCHDSLNIVYIRHGNVSLTENKTQHSACSNGSENNDHSDSEHIDISSSSSRSETSSPTNDVQNQTESQFLIPINQIQMTYVAYNGGKTIAFDIFLLLVGACTRE